MTFDPQRVETITVDSYGTLVDTDSVERALADRTDNAEAVSTLWRSRSLMYTMVGNFIDRYQPFYEMNRAALQFALDVYGIDLPPAERDEILATYHELDVFDDVRDGLERFRELGYEVFVVSNGNPAMLDSMVAHSGIGDIIADTVSADEIEIFKPDIRIYQHAAGRVGTPIENIVHVAAPTFDVQGAMHAGMQAAWLNRSGEPYEGFGPDPDITVESFHDLGDELEV